MDFNPVNESVKKLVFYGRVKKKKKKGDESIISAVELRSQTVPFVPYGFRLCGRRKVLTRSYSRDHREDLPNLGYLVDFLFENEFEKYWNEPIVDTLFRKFSNFL